MEGVHQWRLKTGWIDAFKCPHSPSAQATLLLRAAPSLDPDGRDSSVLPKFRRPFHGRQHDANLSRLSDRLGEKCHLPRRPFGVSSASLSHIDTVQTLDRTTTSLLHQATSCLLWQKACILARDRRRLQSDFPSRTEESD